MSSSNSTTLYYYIIYIYIFCFSFYETEILNDLVLVCTRPDDSKATFNPPGNEDGRRVADM